MTFDPQLNAAALVPEPTAAVPLTEIAPVPPAHTCPPDDVDPMISAAVRLRLSVNTVPPVEGVPTNGTTTNGAPYDPDAHDRSLSPKPSVS